MLVASLLVLVAGLSLLLVALLGFSVLLAAVLRRLCLSILYHTSSTALACSALNVTSVGAAIATAWLGVGVLVTLIGLCLAASLLLLAAGFLLFAAILLVSTLSIGTCA